MFSTKSVCPSRLQIKYRLLQQLTHSRCSCWSAYQALSSGDPWRSADLWPSWSSQRVNRFVRESWSKVGCWTSLRLPLSWMQQASRVQGCSNQPGRGYCRLSRLAGGARSRFRQKLLERILFSAVLQLRDRHSQMIIGEVTHAPDYLWLGFYNYFGVGWDLKADASYWFRLRR